MTVAKWKRYAAGLRIAGVLLIVALVGVAAYQVYYFYSDKLGATPGKTIDAYFAALGQGDYQEVYRLSSKTRLTDIYGRRITEGEFVEQVKSLTGGHRLPFGRVESTRLAEREGARYYVVKLNSVVGGKAGESQLVVEVRRENSAWVVVYPFAIMLRGA